MRDFPKSADLPDPPKAGIASPTEDFFDYVGHENEQRERDKKVGTILAYLAVGAFVILCVAGVFWVVASIVKDIFG